MKKLFTFLLCVAPLLSFAQFSWNDIVFTFEDTVYPHYVVIDTVNYHHNIWQTGRPNKTFFTSARSVPNAMVTDTLNPYPANDTSVFIVKVPFRYFVTGWGLSAPVSTQFFYQMKKDTGCIAMVEISQDSCATWYNVKDSLPSLVSSVTPLADTTSGWAFYTINYNVITLFSLSITDSFYLRFTFITDTSSTGKDGWMIDDIFTQYYVEGPAQLVSNNNLVSVYPNPSAGSIYIQCNDPQAKNGSVTIYNAAGQRVYHTDKFAGGHYLEPALPDGIYTLRYATEREYCNKQLIIRR